MYARTLQYYLIAFVLGVYLMFVGEGQLWLLTGTLFGVVLLVRFILSPLEDGWREKQLAERRKDIVEIARMVHESRQFVEQFMGRNPHETFASPRGKATLLHHLKAYETYLEQVGVQRKRMKLTGQYLYDDSYWAQLQMYALRGKEQRELPPLPPESSSVHRYLHRTK